jgi:methionyl-tRNA formyltransferase
MVGMHSVWNGGWSVARIVFLGTPAFAVPTLLALAREHQVAGVVTQPDRRAGRGRKLIASPVKEAAQTQGVPVYQPTSLRTPEARARLASWQPEVITVAAFGQILDASVLALPPHGCLNIHASLLPRYRGAAPIPAAILAGDAVTGVTIMQMDEGLDTGPILAQVECSINCGDTTSTLTAKLAELGAQLLIETLPGWLSGTVGAQPQDDSKATYCRTLKKEDGRLDWAQPAAYLSRQVRAFDPWPGTFTAWRGRRLKVLSARARPEREGAGPTGRVVDLDPGVGVMTGEGLLELLKVQPAGRQPMAATAFARGQRDLIGSLLGARP